MQKSATIYMVVWEDPTTHLMASGDETPDMTLCYSVGKLRKHKNKDGTIDNEKVDIVHSWYDDDTRDCTVIKRTLIKKTIKRIYSIKL